MRNLVVACTLVLVLGLAYVVASAGSELIDAFLARPAPQELALVVVTLAGTLLVVAALWQSVQFSRQGKALRAANGRIEGVSRTAQALGADQGAVDGAMAQLVGSEPEDTLTTLSQKLTEAERSALLQRSHNEAVDLESRADDIRRRQQALRLRVGDAIEKRRLVDPILNELKERQAAVDRALEEFSATDTGASLEEQLGQLIGFVKQTEARFELFDRSLGKLDGLKNELAALHARVAPMEAPVGGIRTLLREIGRLGDRLAADLDRMEKDGDKTLGDRVTELAQAKGEFEERVSRLTEQVAQLELLRSDIGGLLGKLSGALDANRRDNVALTRAQNVAKA
jgi:hypothetical protein